MSTMGVTISQSSPKLTDSPTNLISAGPHFLLRISTGTPFGKNVSDSRMNSATNCRDLNSSYERIIDLIYQALKSAGASRHQENKLLKKAPSPWWNEECNEIIRSKNQRFREFKQHPSSDNLHKYLDACKTASKSFKKKKKTSFQQFCFSLNVDMPLSNVWRYIRAFSNKKKVTSAKLQYLRKHFKMRSTSSHLSYLLNHSHRWT